MTKLVKLSSSVITSDVTNGGEEELLKQFGFAILLLLMPQV